MPVIWKQASPPNIVFARIIYDEWLLSFDLCPVLTIHTDDVDFVNQPMALELVVERIQEKLGGKEEIDFNEKLA